MTLCLLFSHHWGGSTVDTHDMPGGDGPKRKRFTGHPVLWEQTTSQVNEVITEINGVVEDEATLFAQNSFARSLVDEEISSLMSEFALAKSAQLKLRQSRAEAVLTQAKELRKLIREMVDEEALLIILANLD